MEPYQDRPDLDLPPHSPTPGSKRPAPRGSSAYPRKRAIKACQVCRARRTKCDNAKPRCSFCEKVGAECIQTPVDPSSFDPASLQILSRLDDLEQLVRAGQSTAKLEKLEKLDRNQLLPCSIDAVLRWTSLRALRGQYQHTSPAFPSTGTAGLQETPSPPNLGLDGLEPGRMNAVVEAYFSYCWTKNPILDEQQTRQMVRKVAMQGIDWSPEACLTLLVCALGTLATPFNNGQYFSRVSEEYCIAETFFLAAKKRLGMLIGTSSLIEAQCMFLAGVYSMCCFERVLAWRFFMQSLACCQTFPSLSNLQQDDGEQSNGPDRRTAAAEQAIYWSAWKSEREVNIDLNLPGYLFSDLDIAGYPPFFPTPPDHDDGAPSAANPEKQDRERTAWYFYLSEISLLRLRRRMAKEILEFEPIHGVSTLVGLAKAVTDREHQVSNWIQALPESMSMNSPQQEDEVCRFVLRGHLMDVYETLYWPFIDWAIRSGSLSTDQNSHLLSSLATKGFQIHVDRIAINRPGFTHRHHGTFGMIKSCTRSALILLAAGYTQTPSGKTHGAQPYQMPTGWQDAVCDVIRLLENWQHEASDLSKMLLTLSQLWHNWQFEVAGQVAT